MWHSSPCAEIILGVLRPLVRFGEQHAARIGLVELGADSLEHVMGFGKVLVVGAFPLDQVGHRIEPQPVDAEIEPEAHDAEHGFDHARIVEIQIGLMRIEAVPVIRAGDRVPGPVRPLGVEEDDARAGIFLVAVGPDIEIARRRAGFGAPRPLKPGMLVGGVVDDEFGDDADATRMRRRNEALHIGHRSIIGMHRAVFADVVSVIEPRRRIERQQPDRVDAELDDVIELHHQPGEVSDAVIVGVEERLDVHLVDDRVLVPERIVRRRQR